MRHEINSGIFYTDAELRTACGGRRSSLFQPTVVDVTCIHELPRQRVLLDSCNPARYREILLLFVASDFVSARAARESGNDAALLANMRKRAAIAPGHPSLQIALARGLALDGGGAGAVALCNRIADLCLSFRASDMNFGQLNLPRG